MAIEGIPNSDFSTIAHEMRHQYDFEVGNIADSQNTELSATNPAEIRAVATKTEQGQLRVYLKEQVTVELK